MDRTCFSQILHTEKLAITSTAKFLWILTYPDRQFVNIAGTKAVDQLNKWIKNLYHNVRSLWSFTYELNEFLFIQGLQSQQLTEAATWTIFTSNRFNFVLSRNQRVIAKWLYYHICFRILREVITRLVYGKQQTWDSCWEIYKMINQQVKTELKTIVMDRTGVNLPIFV